MINHLVLNTQVLETHQIDYDNDISVQFQLVNGSLLQDSYSFKNNKTNIKYNFLSSASKDELINLRIDTKTARKILESNQIKSFKDKDSFLEFGNTDQLYVVTSSLIYDYKLNIIPSKINLDGSFESSDLNCTEESLILFVKHLESMDCITIIDPITIKRNDGWYSNVDNFHISFGTILFDSEQFSKFIVKDKDLYKSYLSRSMIDYFMLTEYKKLIGL